MKTIDYARAKREMPGLRAALTRAKNSGDPVKVLEAVEKAYDAFDEWGAWPDGWATWRVAVMDAHRDWLHDGWPTEPGVDAELDRRFIRATER